MTPIQLQDTILHAVGEPEGVFHTRDLVRAYVQHAEQMLGMARAITETTASLALVYNQGIYDLTAAGGFTGFIYPLSVTVNRRVLFPTTLSRVVNQDREWGKAIEFPREFFMLSSTYLGVYPTPPSAGMVARVNFIRLPEVIDDSSAYITGPEWHETLGEYVAAILLAKEQKYQLAELKLQVFLEAIGIARDPRFAQAEVKSDQAENMQQPFHDAREG